MAGGATGGFGEMAGHGLVLTWGGDPHLWGGYIPLPWLAHRSPEKTLWKTGVHVLGGKPFRGAEKVLSLHKIFNPSILCQKVM